VSRLKLLMVPILAFAAMLSLSGCVAYPDYGGGGYYGGGGGYYAPSAAVIVPAPVYRPYYGDYYRGGWGRGHWR
jgi:hypothetical protein